MAPIHPGEILKEELLIPCGISQSQLAQELKISFRRINEICQGRRPITIDTALRLSIYFEIVDGRDGNIYLYVGEKNDDSGREIKIGILKEEFNKLSGSKYDSPKESLEGH
ncbi:15445_t:CDS:2 [Entrophospora sp. SA101]|nr:15445_t:CDS:2 [Entrophospora sp. SA101]